jgi:hypothetical protein
MKRHLLPAGLALALAACAGPPVPRQAVPLSDLRQDLVGARGDAPPPEPEGACWARQTTPAVILTVTEQEALATAPPTEGTASTTAYRSVTRQQIVQDRQDVWFRTPCSTEGNVAFVASLQRALKARGLYSGPISGRRNAATSEAVRRLQAKNGLDSPILSLTAARDLGLVPVDRDTLE